MSAPRDFFVVTAQVIPVVLLAVATQQAVGPFTGRLRLLEERSQRLQDEGTRRDKGSLYREIVEEQVKRNRRLHLIRRIWVLPLLMGSALGLFVAEGVCLAVLFREGDGPTWAAGVVLLLVLCALGSITLGVIVAIARAISERPLTYE